MLILEKVVRAKEIKVEIEKEKLGVDNLNLLNKCQ